MLGTLAVPGEENRDAKFAFSRKVSSHFSIARSRDTVCEGRKSLFPPWVDIYPGGRGYHIYPLGRCLRPPYVRSSGRGGGACASRRAAPSIYIYCTYIVHTYILSRRAAPNIYIYIVHTLYTYIYCRGELLPVYIYTLCIYCTHIYCRGELLPVAAVSRRLIAQGG